MRYLILWEQIQLIGLSESLNLSCFLYVIFLSTYCCPGVFICFSHVTFSTNLPYLWLLARQSNGSQCKNRWTEIPVDHFDPYQVPEQIFTDLKHDPVNLPIVCNQSILWTYTLVGSNVQRLRTQSIKMQITTTCIINVKSWIIIYHRKIYDSTFIIWPLIQWNVPVTVVLEVIWYALLPYAVHRMIIMFQQLS